MRKWLLFGPERSVETAAPGQPGDAGKPVKRSSIEQEFLPAYQEIIERPPSGFGRAFGFTIMGLCAAAIIWAATGSLDIVASAPGKIVLEGYSKTIQAPIDGEVTVIRVRDGQRVTRGDVLLELNSTSAEAEIRRLSEQFVFSELEVSRLSALLSDDPETAFKPPEGAKAMQIASQQSFLTMQLHEQGTRIQTIEAEIASNLAEQRSVEIAIVENDKVLNSMRQRYDARKSLTDKGLSARSELMELDEQILLRDADGKQQNARLGVLRAQEKSLATKADQQRAEWRSTIRSQLENALKTSAGLRQDLIKARENGRRQTITTPVAGRVQQSTVHTIGGVVRQGDPVMVIVPDDDELKAEVNILSKDVGFVRKGQQVELKVDSFPYSKYGTVKGQVLFVSGDSAEDEKLGLVYPAQVSLDVKAIDVDGRKVALSPGMGVSAEIRTGERKIIEYLLSPLQQYRSDAMRER